MPDYIMPMLPQEPFMLQPIDNPEMPGSIGPYRADEFIQDPDTGVTRSTEEGGSNTYLPVVSQQGMTLNTQDEDGNAGQWMVMPLPDNTMALDGADAGSLTDSQRDAITDRTGAVS
jgi:hypothetical protein